MLVLRKSIVGAITDWVNLEQIGRTFKIHLLLTQLMLVQMGSASERVVSLSVKPRLCNYVGQALLLLGIE